MVCLRNTSSRRSRRCSQACAAAHDAFDAAGRLRLHGTPAADNAPDGVNVKPSAGHRHFVHRLRHPSGAGGVLMLMY